MSSRFLPVSFACFFLIAAGAFGQTQSAPPAQPSSGAAPSAQATQQNPSSNTPSDSAPPKKVWTNEDLPSPGGQPGISTFHAPDSKPANSSVKPKPNRSRDARSYHDQIARLEDQIPPLDKQIANLQAGLNGTPVNETRHYGARADDWRDELARLKKKRQDILDRISALQDEARHHGIDPNQLP